jgi:hypothetical protein
MGPHFNAATTMIERKRLPPGLAAVLNDPGVLRAAIGELHSYASTNQAEGRPRRGIVFRVVKDWERQAIRQKLWSYFGPKDAPAREAFFDVLTGHMHIIDDSAVSHAHARHGARSEGNELLVLTILDFMKIPEVVDLRYLVEFSVAKGMPRLVYQKSYDRCTLVVVEELHKNAGLLIKTAYKKK